MAQPTLSAYQQSNYTDASSAAETIPSVSWLAGDRVLVVGVTEDSGITLSTPTVSGLTFSSIGSANGAGNARAYMWAALAGSNGSGSISLGTDVANARRGASAFVFNGSDGFGTPVVLEGSTAKTINLTRSQANSHVVVVMADWNAVNDTVVTATPTGTVRVAISVAGIYSAYVTSYGDQGAPGTTAYGITDHTGTVDMTGLAVEALGTASGGGGTNAGPLVNAARLKSLAGGALAS